MIGFSVTYLQVFGVLLLIRLLVTFAKMSWIGTIPEVSTRRTRIFINLYN
jgi:hypothetical protein